MSDQVIHKVPLPFGLQRRVRLMAAEHGTTMNAVILAALLAYLDTPNPPPPVQRRLSDPLASFVSDLCECGPEYEVPSGVLHEAFREYAPPADLAALHRSVFGAAIQQAYPGIKSARVRRGGKLIYIYRGVRLRTTSRDLPVT